MERRKFLKLAGVGSVPLFFNGCYSAGNKLDFQIQIDSNRKRGHLTREELVSFKKENLKTKTAIIGGGVAGVAAYASLNGEDCMLFDLNSFLGGTAGGGNYKSTRFARGAHYDIIYPENYGKEALALLQKAGVVELDEFNNEYHFKDQEFIIKHKNESTCLRNGVRVTEPLAGFPELNTFVELLMPFKGEMVLPSRLIDKKFHYLNDVSFLDWLSTKYQFSKEFMEAVDYQMKDDWGAASNKVSALAGIHYYMCRDYEKDLELISPPEGNQYFVEKLLSITDYENIYLNHICHSIKQKNDGGFMLNIIDFEKKIIKEVVAENVVYAGQKHALKFIFPEAYRKELVAEYSNWVSINIVLKKSAKQNNYWQNDFISEDENFLGFSDSYAQYDYLEEEQVLTAYYCFEEKESLVEIENNPKEIIDKTIGYVSSSLEKNIKNNIECVNVNLLGHAMPTPKQNYLFTDWNKDRPYSNFTYAGVDTGKLPLFFEALDSGIQAVKDIK